MPASELDRLVAALRARPFELTEDPAPARRRIEAFADVYAPPEGVEIEPTELAGRPAERLTAGDGPRVLYLHGGGFVTGSPASHRHLAGKLAEELGGQVTTLDYRLAPEHPFPAARDDCARACEAMEGPYALAGDSAGGNLVFAAAAALRDRGAPLPAALLALSPWPNLAASDEAFELLAPLDPLLSRAVADWHAERYLAETPAADPGASPLFADLSGLPPTLIQAGDREVFFGDACRLHMRLLAAGVDAQLQVWPRMIHVWHLHWPSLAEGREAIAAGARFIETTLKEAAA